MSNDDIPKIGQARREPTRRFHLVPGDKNCKHYSIEIDEQRREITCTRCGATLDPFDWLLAVALREENIAQRANWMEVEIRSARKGLAALKKEERLTKARLRNARRQLRKIEHGGAK